MHKPLVPEIAEGSNKDFVHAVTEMSLFEAKDLYQIAKTRLFDVNHWHDFAGTGSAHFMLTDAHGNETEHEPQVGDYLRIEIPAPATNTGDGYDWVRIEAVEECSDLQKEQEWLAIKVRPSINPRHPERPVAHFFSEEATSSFVVEREGVVVRARVHGRNEVPNEQPHNLFDKIRNLFVAVGAMLGFANAQWNSLVKGLIELERK